jgi:DNA-binding Lrp family transcriptional regulator
VPSTEKNPAPLLPPDGANCPSIALGIEELSDILGLSPEAVKSALEKLESQGVIRREGADLCVRDVTRLKAFRSDGNNP